MTQKNTGVFKSKPRTRELRHAGGSERAVGLCGLGVVLVLVLVAVMWNNSSGTLSKGVSDSGNLTVPTLDLISGMVTAMLSALVLFLGWPLYRLTVILTGFLLGAGLAGSVGWLASGENYNAALVAAGVGGIVGGIAAWPTEVAIRTFSGSIAGLFLGLAVGSSMGSPVAVAGCALGGLLLGGALTFLFYRALIILYSSILGSLGLVYGILCMWHSNGSVKLRALHFGIAACFTVIGILAQRSLGKEEKEPSGN